MKKLTIISVICLLAIATNLSAQEPTLSQTIDFIKLNTIKKPTPRFGKFTDDKLDYKSYDGTKYNHMMDRVETVEFDNEYVYFKCSTAVLKVRYWDIMSVETYDEEKYGGVLFTSTKNFYQYFEDNEQKVVANNNALLFYFNESGAKMLKAWKHFLKLKGINLTGDLF